MVDQLEQKLQQSNPLIMGIVNITPDSFADGGKYNAYDKAMTRIETLIQQGADIIDLGAESTRPGAAEVSEEIELSRLRPILESYQDYFDVPLSLDTRKAEVAELGLKHNVSIINDISGLTHDSRMCDVIKRYDAWVVIMHMQQTPQNMQDNPHYNDVIKDINSFFKNQIDTLKALKRNKIILDPGIGFGKTLEHNLTIIKQFDQFKKHKLPLLIGTSNKSFIGQLTHQPVAKRGGGTVASSLLACQKGASIVRVHDVELLKNAILVYNELKEHV
ncbi:dihydropteroate synthase [Candidatus Marinamargulisbacteria bacterium SCGC AG-414-C22]|nr:dihydropteroate synthase [Candidatus Marinamargulisbacteria bacterium SCGC AG-414-C22]